MGSMEPNTSHLLRKVVLWSVYRETVGLESQAEGAWTLLQGQQGTAEGSKQGGNRWIYALFESGFWEKGEAVRRLLLRSSPGILGRMGMGRRRP